jgi:ferritin
MKYTATALSLLLSTATTVRGFTPHGTRMIHAAQHGNRMTMTPLASRMFHRSIVAPLSAATSSITETETLPVVYNQQVTNELMASQLYLSASLWCERRELVGMAEYMRSESAEERGHALEFIDFANKRHMPLQLQTLEAPPSDWKSVTDLWESLLNAEKENTQALQKLGQVAAENKDSPDATLLTTFLDPFFTEQMESENELRKIVAKVRDMESTPGLLRQLDAEFGNKIEK